jgi:glycosyltransferase involved in cell wall biosynthesis
MGESNVTTGPRLTVLIPTRDRCDTLSSAIKSCLAQDYDNLRIIVSDNCSSDNTHEVVNGFDDPRLSYVRTPQRLSMTGNFEFSLSLVEEGSYLMHLGDDDGLILNGASQVAQIIRETGSLAINSAHAVYHWPTSLYAGYANRLILPFGHGYRRVSGLDAAREVIAFRRGYSFLPSTYTGFVAKSVINAVAGGGAYYSSITPDSYSGFANAGVLDTYIQTCRPFAIAGLSGRSNGGSNVTSGDRREADRYLAENDLPTHEDIVYCPKSIPLVVAEAFLQARDRVSRLGSVDLDIEKLCRVALRDTAAENYAIVRAAVAAMVERQGLSLSVPPTPNLAQKIGRGFDRARLRVRRLSEGYRRINAREHGVKDVAGAGELARELLGSIGG